MHFKNFADDLQKVLDKKKYVHSHTETAIQMFCTVLINFELTYL